MRENSDALNIIEKELQEEINRYNNELISLLVGDSTQKCADWIDHEIAMLSLISRKICVCLDFGSSDELYENIASLLDSVKKLEYSSEYTPAVLSDAIDCILSMMNNSEKKEILKTIINERYGELESNTTISEELVFMLTKMAGYYEKHRDFNMAGAIITYLVSISAERNKENILRHREIIVKSVSQIIEICPNECYSICNRSKKYFRGIHDEYTSDFLWFSGCLLQGRNKSKEAVVVFTNCYRIRLELYGEQDWYTAIARREYAVLSLSINSNENNKDELAFLHRFINCIEEGSYPEVDRDTLKILEGKTLYILLLYKLNHEDFHSYEYLHSLYHQICSEYNEQTLEPLIKLRLSHNLIGGFYLKKGKYIRAEQAFLNAVNAHFPDNVTEIITKAQVKSNLLMVYYVENDLQQAAPLITELLDLIEQDDSGIEEKDKYRILTLYNSLVSQSFLDIDKEEVELLTSELDDISAQISAWKENGEGISPEKVIFFITGIQLLLQNENLSPEQCNDYCDALSIIDKFGLEQLETGQKVVLRLVLILRRPKCMK